MTEQVPEVGTFWLVANALAHDASLSADVAARTGVRVAEAASGAEGRRHGAQSRG